MGEISQEHDFLTWGIQIFVRKVKQCVRKYYITWLITQFVAIDIAPLRVLFCNHPFWDKSPLWFLKILNLPLFSLGNFRIFKNPLGQYIPNHPPKHVITSTNYIT